jgi:hypothetical protein
VLIHFLKFGESLVGLFVLEVFQLSFGLNCDTLHSASITLFT